MVRVKFYEPNENKPMKFAVIASRYEGKWVFCKHKDRDTYEFPGGHWEKGETIEETGRRELWEETGAEDYILKPVCIYSVLRNSGEEETFGMLFYAEIKSFGQLPDYEIQKVELFTELPESWTYPQIQPILLKRVRQYIEEKC